MATNASNTLPPAVTTSLFAATSYDCNTYGSGTYSNTTCQTTTDSGSSQQSLVDTGTSIYIGIAFGIALIITAFILLIRMHRKKHF